MQMLVQERVTDSDMASAPSTLFVVREVEIARMAPNRSRIAGIRLPGAIVSIDYHFGWKSWTLRTEPFEQRATDYVRYTLPQAVAAFEKLVGLHLPDIRVIEYGVGLYSAASSTISENPWALRDGGTYEVRHPSNGCKRYSAKIRHDRCMVVPLARNGEPITDAEFDPRLWTIEEWKSLRECPAAAQAQTGLSAGPLGLDTTAAN
ncbi:hypothetical protein LA345_40835 (plasmid) [Burkholderia vietnamiensis]|uniref:Uncharacterized protein n=1 Tax=Burkholderia vietnamiensis (strain G4 / LMG 22486) TaxID=269482 RepID=A4JTU5_BURVG|nr:hypothetical protein Bcep1808_6811 [Burkholderia vietnamiensis G4]MCB4350143.1 hypothetical protein [Burkholderia vietnamiensis]